MLQKAIALSQFPLFKDVEPQVISIADTTPRRQFDAGEQIVLDPGLGFIERGAVRVYRQGDNRVLINVIPAGQLFGVSTLFNDTRAETDLIAQGKTQICFIRDQVLLDMMAQSRELTRNYLAFVSRRVCFLNEKLYSFTAPDAQARMMEYLEHNKKGGEVQIKSMMQLAGLLGIGRASVYRAVESLEKAGKIRREGKKIYILKENVL